jgi:rhodanese-related sulfurtransferase
VNPVENTIISAKETITKPIPTPPPLHKNSTADEVRKRLKWGEPALTILDVRKREDFNQEHIMGAMSMEMSVLVETARDSLHWNRDIYVYGENDEQAEQAANALREAGFVNVSHLEGGIQAWKDANGPMEGPLTWNDGRVRILKQGKKD